MQSHLCPFAHPLPHAPSPGTLTYRPSYHVMAHFSRFIPRGARIVKTEVKPPKGDKGSPKAAPAPLAVAAIAGDSLVVVTLNQDGSQSVEYDLDLGGGRVAQLTMPPYSMQTFTIPLPKP